MSVERGHWPSTLVVRDPEDEDIVVGELAATGAAQAEQMLERGWRASHEPPPPAHERARILREAADRIALELDSHAQLIAREGVKTIREARIEVGRAVETLRLSAEEAKRIGGAVLPFDQVAKGEDRLGWWTRRPAGLVIAITPYNDPLNLVAHKIGPAIAAGAPVILKPHPQTPFSALRLVEHLHEAGAGEDRLQVALGRSDLGRALVSDRRPRVVSFTGGREAGEGVAAVAGMKTLLLELGGVGIVAVAADADLGAAAAAIHSGAFWAAGQNCVRAQRIVVDAVVAGELTERLLTLASATRLGPKLDETTDMGPLVDCAAAERLRCAVATMRDAGCQVRGRGLGSKTRLPPTWILGAQDIGALFSQELFGPVSTIETARGSGELLESLGGGSGAINAAIFTRSLDMALTAFERARAAAVLVNDSTDFRIDAMPFGGTGSAGLGREGVADAVEAMSEKRLIILRRSPSSTQELRD